MKITEDKYIDFLFFIFVFRKICLSLYNVSICDDLTAASNKHYEKEVQSQTSQWQFYFSLCYNVPALLTIGFYGSWSDQISRKLPLFICPMGSFLMALIYLFSAIFIYSPVEYLLCAELIFGFSGGMSAFLMASFSFLSIKARPKHRTSRISVAHAVERFAHALAFFSSGVLLDNAGFITVYAIVLFFYSLTLVYIGFGLQEPKKVAENAPSSEKSLCSRVVVVLGLHHLKMALQVTFKKRHGGARKYIIAVLIVCFLLALTSGNKSAYSIVSI